jgi:hypothetical protein
MNAYLQLTVCNSDELRKIFIGFPGIDADEQRDLCVVLSTGGNPASTDGRVQTC